MIIAWISRDELAFDVFTQAAVAVRSVDSGILGPLVPEIVLATGHSQSAVYLSEYHDRVHPTRRVIDGFLIHGGGGPLAEGVRTKVFKVNAETDLWRMRQARARQPDSDDLRTWEVAGSSHADEYYMSHVTELQQRDFGSALSFECDLPPNSRIPFRYALFAAYEHLDSWVREGTPPPRAPPIELATTEPHVTAARDSLGNALGGLRLPDHDVPIATNGGRNSGQRFCDLFGSHVPFDADRLDRLYPTPADYSEEYSASVERALHAGYILEVDAETMLEEARRRVQAMETPDPGGNLTSALGPFRLSGGSSPARGEPH